MSRRTSVTCTGSSLTASFETANPPLIWRFDLERNHSFTLALQGEVGDWELGVTSPKGDFYPVVHFASREDAEEAFLRIEHALARRRTSLGYMGKVIVGFVIGVLALTTSIAAVAYFIHHNGHSTLVDTASSNRGEVQEGVPMSADDILKPPPVQ